MKSTLSCKEVVPGLGYQVASIPHNQSSRQKIRSYYTTTILGLGAVILLEAIIY